MDTIRTILQAIYDSPHYAFGWIVIACLAVLPAIVSGNLVQHYLTRLGKGEIPITAAGKLLLLNIAVLTTCVSIMAYAFYLYVFT